MSEKQTIYLQLLDGVNSGSHYKIDLVNKSLSIDGKYLIKEGEHKDPLIDGLELNFIDYDNFIINKEFNEDITMLEKLYELYKYSIPNEFNLGSKPYFSAEPIETLTDAQLSINYPRTFAQAMLEGYILCSGLAGTLNWMFTNKEHWFWQSKFDNEFIVLKSFVK